MEPNPKEQPPLSPVGEFSTILTLSEQYRQAVARVEQEPLVAVSQLEQLQQTLAQASLLASRNETLEDLSTSQLQYVALPHHLAKALVQAPMNLQANSEAVAFSNRLQNLQRASDLWWSFFQSMEQLELVTAKEKEDCQALVELSSSMVPENDNSNNNPQEMKFYSVSRDVKIARFQAKKQTQQKLQQLRALLARRNRLGINEHGEMDGHDQESLERDLCLQTLELSKQEALEEWSSVIQELPMIARRVQQVQQNSWQLDHSTGGSLSTEDSRMRSRPPPPARPLEVTHITKDVLTGQLNLQKEQVRSKVFRRGWNQPTMSLEELADREVADAREREARQKEAEASQKEAPRRYEQLVKDGMDDNAALVDASAPLDRAWDDFKDENPRGSGNKRADVGDRNF